METHDLLGPSAETVAVRPENMSKKTKKKVIATFRIPEQPVTNFNGDGVNTHILKNVV